MTQRDVRVYLKAKPATWAELARVWSRKRRRERRTSGDGGTGASHVRIFFIIFAVSYHIPYAGER